MTVGKKNHLLHKGRLSTRVKVEVLGLFAVALTACGFPSRIIATEVPPSIVASSTPLPPTLRSPLVLDIPSRIPSPVLEPTMVSTEWFVNADSIDKTITDISLWTKSVIGQHDPKQYIKLIQDKEFIKSHEIDLEHLKQNACGLAVTATLLNTLKLIQSGIPGDISISDLLMENIDRTYSYKGSDHSIVEKNYTMSIFSIIDILKRHDPNQNLYSINLLPSTVLQINNNTEITTVDTKNFVNQMGAFRGSIGLILTQMHESGHFLILTGVKLDQTTGRVSALVVDVFENEIYKVEDLLSIFEFNPVTNTQKIDYAAIIVPVESIK